jgi:hypothetical protein
MTVPVRPLTPDLLDVFERSLRAVGARIAGSWRPGASPAALDALEAYVGGRLSDEARLWWSWRDGVADRGHNAAEYVLGRFWTPLSVQGSADCTRFLRDLFTDFEPDLPPLWDPSWTVLCVEERAHIVIACDRSPQPLSPVMYFDPEFNLSPELPQLPSIGELVHLWMEALEDGTYGIVDGEFNIVDPPEVLVEKWTAKGRPDAVHLL